MNKTKRTGALLGIKGVLAIASLITIALALVVYTASVTINPTSQFTLGVSTDTWTIYINEVNQVRYLPGGTSMPADGTATFAFRVGGTTTRGCAVQIELTSAMNSSLFSRFDITAMYWQAGTGWVSATLYDAATGGSIISSINGLTTTAGYVRQAAGASDTSYLMQVTYSYDNEAITTPVTATFQYTPLPA